MRHNPADWDTYTTKQKDKWYEKSFDERREIINKSYLSLITDENGNLDVMKVLECIKNHLTSRFEFPASTELPPELTSFGLTLPPQA